MIVLTLSDRGIGGGKGGRGGRKFIGEQDFVKEFCKGYNLLPWQPNF